MMTITRGIDAAHRGTGGTRAGRRMEEPEVVEEMSQVYRFREACLCREVPAKVHRDRGVPVGDILAESRL